MPQTTLTAPAILYRLEPVDAAGHRYHLTLTIARPDPAGQRLSLPAWIPGSYLIREFARQIETISARGAAGPVALRKLGKDTWLADVSEGPLTVDYTVYAWDLSVRGAHLDETHGFFNGTSVFLQVHGQEAQPCLLDLVAPAWAPHWGVYTSLPEATDDPQGAARHGFGRYRAPDYDALIDHPVEMGTPQVIGFTAHGAEHELVFTGVVPALDLARLADDIRRICETQIAFFDPQQRRAPFTDSASRYVFLTMVTGDGYGGLEHRASTALMTARTDLPVLGCAEQSEGYRNFLGLVSHEYFHTWHVKRIKPAVFAPYGLAAEGYTRLLWVFEGFTSYYDDLMLLRAGVITREQYLEGVAKTLTAVLRGSGRLKQSVADSSFDAWTRFYRQDENSPNAIVSYYAKGALVAQGLDLFLRQATEGARSLDDVMALLWSRYGESFYTGGGNGLPEDGMGALVAEATGVEVTDFLARYVTGTEDVPLVAWLAADGVQATWKAESTVAALGVRLRAQGNEVTLATVHEDSPAHRAGLSAQDTLVAVAELRVNSEKGLEAILGRYRAGDTVTVHVFRRDELRTFALTLASPADATCTLRDAAAASAATD
jgi:predicted metalloprotease with PDZ domain